ncbi:MAG TPA: hypothetical protein VF043_28240 [Ktedonobacteraceae bacterium]
MSILLTIIPIVLPLLVAPVAGILRQDGLPKATNEGIIVALLLISGAVEALYNHKLSSM